MARALAALRAELQQSRTETRDSTLQAERADAVVASEMRQVRSELSRLARQLAMSNNATRELQKHVWALETPWLARGGEVRCAQNQRCADYVNAGEDSLAATMSVSACRDYCRATFPEVPFFAYHSEAGYTQFQNDPKGRCRCYDSTPCVLIPDSGYTLWSTTHECTKIVGDATAGGA